MKRKKMYRISMLCMGFLAATTLNISAQKVTLSVQNISLKEAFRQLEQASDYKIAYNSSQLDASRLISMDARNQEVTDVLAKLLTDTGCTFKENGKYLVVVPLSEQQQTKHAVGTVTDANGEPIVGANVIVQGTTIGTITDVDGKFELDVPQNATLMISYIGFLDETLVVKGNTGALKVVLREDTQKLDEVVVVGYGTQKRVNLTGSVQSVGAEDLVKRNVSSSSLALQGLVPGMVVSQSSGAPGATASIQIRGTGSINSNNSPLVLIDGVEGDMNSIDMNAIESISVLKDAASASIYGSRASNGVILVSTKRAKDTKVTVTYNGYVGLRTPTEMPQEVDAVTYMEAINLARANNNQEPTYSQDIIQTYLTQGADNIHNYDTNWKDLLLNNAALTHNHSLSLSGGTEAIKTFVNASYNYEDGLIPNNDFNRFALRSNTDAKITDWMRASLNLNIRRTNTLQPTVGANSIMRNVLSFNPLFGAVNSDGTWANGQNGNNPLAMSQVGGTSKSDNNDLDVKGTVVITPVKGLELLGSYSSRRFESKTDAFQNTYDTYEGGNFLMSYPSVKSRSEGWSRYIKNQFNAQATYENTFADKHYLKVLVGFQTDQFKNKSFGGSRKGFYYDGYELMNHGDGSTASNYGSESELTMMSYFGRLNYTFADRYLVEFTGRYDGSSRFKSDNRWGFFPSASVGWRISEESFFESLRQHIDNLKIRASYGSLGNQDINGYYPYAATLASGAAYWFGNDKSYSSGIYASDLSNSAITWEKSRQVDVGLDVTALHNRLDLTFDYYVRTITNMLQKFPVPMAVGLSSPWENAGDMRNNGWDLSVTWRDQIGRVRYSVTANLSDVKNKVTNLFGNEYINDNNTTQEGYPIYSWYGYVADGYFQSQEEIEASPVYGNNKQNVKPGFIRYKDLDGDGQITDADRQIIGDPQPRYTFGLNLSAEWNNFDFNAFFQGVGKRDIYFEGASARPFYVGGTIYEHQLDSWTPENRDAKYPLLLIEGVKGSNPNNIPSSYWVKSGAYMRLKNLSIGYTIPKRIIAPTKLQNVRLYLSGQNLFTLKGGYEGFDPEGSVDTYYPVMRIYTFGLDIRF